MENSLNNITLKLKNNFDIDISMYEESFLRKSILNRCSLVGMPTVMDYTDYLAIDGEEPLNLLRSLKITYSEFFRNSLTFAHLEHWVIPRLIDEKTGKQEIRVWSAGCASGQEPYSVAMLFDRFQYKQGDNLRYRIIATDISEAELDVARKGAYSEEAVQNVRGIQLKKYFTKESENYVVCDALKDHVSFSTYDLLDANSSFPQESIFGNFDIVICSNLLFYYRTEHQQSILQKMVRSMADRGFFITGEAERNIVSNLTTLSLVVPPSPVFQKNRFEVHL